MKSITINKRERVEAYESFREDGIIAFQLVDFTISYFGNESSFTLDTIIKEDGTQTVVDGNGFIPSGYEIK